MRRSWLHTNAGRATGARTFIHRLAVVTSQVNEKWVIPGPSGTRRNRPRPSSAPHESSSISDGFTTRSRRACQVNPYRSGLTID